MIALFLDDRSNLRYTLSSDRGVAQLVARIVWDDEVGGSNPLAPTERTQQRRFVDRNCVLGPNRPYERFMKGPLEQYCGSSIVVMHWPSKPVRRVRFPSPALEE
jgi:hypothetical protein